jgi:hypothetical protein
MMGVVGAFAGGCSEHGIGAGEYTAVRIAKATVTFSADCAALADPNHTTTFKEGETVLVYGVSGDAGDQLYLDLGGVVIPGGEQDDGSFRFSAKDTQINHQIDADITTVTTITVTFTVSGSEYVGKSATHIDVSCSGSNCGGNDTCTATTDFEGVEVEGEDVPEPSPPQNP